MAENNNSFQGGLNLDANPLRQPENSYRNAINLVRLSDKGDYYSFTNEKGTIVYTNINLTGWSIIGQNVLESDIILFFVKNDLTAVKIGIVASDGTYTTKLDDINNELNLDLDHPLDIQSRVLINSHRVVYFTDNKNPVRTLDLDDVPTIGKISKLTGLVPTSNFPLVTNFDVEDSSTTLMCGAYQFAFRYLDSKGNITNISLPSELTSIGQNSIAAGEQYQGGYPDILSGKSITLSITNIDTDYAKLEIIAIYYTGLTNTLVTEVTAQVDISSSSLSFEYKGASLYTVTIEEVQGVTTNYSTAKALEQKDGRLFISNLKENNSIEANLQTIANNIILKYSIDTQPVEFYKIGNNTATKVGYKRGEVYSFGFGVIYKSGAKSFVYHIPAPDTSSGTTGAGTIVTTANTSTKVLGTYKSTLIYPTGQSYPNITDGYSSDNIRYHVMPTFQQEVPYTITDINNRNINILNVFPTFPTGDISTWDSIKNDIQGIFIVRRSRDSSENISVFSQGISNYMMDLFDSDNNSNSTGTVNNGTYDFQKYDLSIKYISKTPFMGGVSLGDYFPDKAGGWSGGHTGGDALQPIMQPNGYTYIAGDPNQEAISTLPTSTITNNNYNSTPISQLYKTLMVWYSPESELLPKIEANTFTKIKRVGQFNFKDTQQVRWQHSEYTDETGTGNGASELVRPPAYWNYYYPSSVDTSKYSETTVNINSNFYVPRNTILPTSFDSVNIRNNNQEEFLLLQTDNNDTFTNDEFTYKQYRVHNVDAGGGASANDAVTTSDQTKNIYELVSTNTTQYGSVSGQNYILCKYIPYDQVGLPNLDNYNNSLVYGGDTYIGRIAFTNKVAIKSKCYSYVGTNQFNYALQSQSDSFGPEYLDFRSTIEFYIESSKNTDLRHNLLGGNSYYRFTGNYNVLVTNPSLVDDTKSYNDQYDFENNIQLFNSKPDIASIVNNNFKTRTIWSDQTILGELRDRYRDIGVDNFYDLPFNTGEIWDSFVFNNILYLQTPKTLWKTFVNAISQSASTAGQVTLGTGGVFPVDLPPQQVITQQGGYAGTISQWGGFSTPFGYIFPDSLQGKVFILGEGLEEISMNGMIRFMQDNLSVLDDTYTGYIDNPFKSGSKGLLSSFDFEVKRWLLVKNHPANPFTVSYDPIAKQWTSLHTYSPNCLIVRDNRLFGIDNSETNLKLYEHNRGNYGSFYSDSIKPFSISIVVNTGQGYSEGKRTSISPDTNKVFDNIKVFADSDSSTKIQAYRGTTDTLEVYTDRQHTGVNNILWGNVYGSIPLRNQVKGQLLRDNYNFKVPLNSLISDNNAIFDTNGNLITGNIDQNRLYRERIKGNYCIIKFTFDNIDNYKLVLNQINTEFREYKR